MKPYCLGPNKSVTKHVSDAVNSLIEMEGMAVFLKETVHQKVKNVYVSNAYYGDHMSSFSQTCPLFGPKKCIWPGFLNYPKCPGFGFCVRFVLKPYAGTAFLIPLPLNFWALPPAPTNILILNKMSTHQGAAINMRSFQITLDAAHVGCRVAKSTFFCTKFSWF